MITFHVHLVIFRDPEADRGPEKNWGRENKRGGGSVERGGKENDSVLSPFSLRPFPSVVVSPPTPVSRPPPIFPVGVRGWVFVDCLIWLWYLRCTSMIQHSVSVQTSQRIILVMSLFQDVSPGFVLCSPDNLCHTVRTFDAQVRLNQVYLLWSVGR